MAEKSSTRKECCTDLMNLPEEMEAVLLQHGGMRKLKKLIPDREHFTEEAKHFHALSDPIRLQILSALQIANLCPCLLTEITGLSNSKLSYHLNILEEANLIVSSPKKKWRIYLLTEIGRSRIKG